MEKAKPTYDLDAIKSDAAKRGLEVTTSAALGAAALGFGYSEMMGVVLTIKRTQFKKSMTSYADHAVWQDVYHVPSEAGLLYVKFTAGTLTRFRLLSFKEK